MCIHMDTCFFWCALDRVFLWATYIHQSPPATMRWEKDSSLSSTACHCCRFLRCLHNLITAGFLAATPRKNSYRTCQFRGRFWGTHNYRIKPRPDKNLEQHRKRGGHISSISSWEPGIMEQTHAATSRTFIILHFRYMNFPMTVNHLSSAHAPTSPLLDFVLWQGSSSADV